MSRKRMKSRPGPKKQTPKYDPEAVGSKYARKRLERACTRYERALRSGMTMPRRDGDINGQVQRYVQQQVYQQRRYVQIRDALCELGLPSALFVPYMSFCRQIDKVYRRYEGEARLTMARVILEKWHGMGNNRETMLELARKVFELELDGPDDQSAGQGPSDRKSTP